MVASSTGVQLMPFGFRFCWYPGTGGTRTVWEVQNSTQYDVQVPVQ